MPPGRDRCRPNGSARTTTAPTPNPPGPGRCLAACERKDQPGHHRAEPHRKAGDRAERAERPPPLAVGDGSGLGSGVRDMTLRWEAVVVDAEDPSALGRWWADALGWEIDADDTFGIEIKPRREGSSRPALVFVLGPAKAGKNRLHLDFQASDQAPACRLSWCRQG
jgi:hypothetical protein